MKYTEYKSLDLSKTGEEILKNWREEKIFEKSIESREGAKPFVFFEGPPSANGMPGIHHVMARTIKDIFCRYKTQKGFQVKRKAGWDTHGLPVELGVEKELGITKEDIGTKISVEEYNAACRKAVMKYTDVWNDLTEKMGYWVDMNDPYITYENKYIESVWWLLKQLYNKNLLYKGYTIQPYSPKAGTGLSSHELNQPGTYRDVKDTTVVAQFKVKGGQVLPFGEDLGEVYFLAWTTTPWTLPSNTALCVGPKVEYVLVKSYNQYTFQPINVVLAKNLVSKVFSGRYFVCENDEELGKYDTTDKKIPFLIQNHYSGKELVGIQYEQLLPYTLPYENPEKAFQVISGDFVTTEDGTGIVHIAPTFGADDAQVAKAAGVPPMLVLDENDNPVPLVDLQGKFVAQMGDLAGKYVKNEYYNESEAPEKSVDVEIAIALKEQNKAFKVEKYEHSYPHCWRTDKPVLYYPLDSWFIKATAAKKRMVELNNTINWKPKSTGTGRFGNWLENLNDWNLSRSRFWGIPLPIWRTEEGDEEVCIGSVEELKLACDEAIKVGFMTKNPLVEFELNNMDKRNYESFDLHKNYVDEIILVSPKGKPMKREADLIDVWFDSGAMPYAQWHYPFENRELIDGGRHSETCTEQSRSIVSESKSENLKQVQVDQRAFPADCIAEGVDQTRGWFYTLHAIATMVFDSEAYKNVVSNGLVLDKNGQKMSKRLGNAIDPFTTIDKYGSDATRWYMISNAQPWDNLKFDLEGITEVQRKFFRALHNTYAFFSLYANIDEFIHKESYIPVAQRSEIDRWIISKLNSLVNEVDAAYNAYEPTKATRAIQEFVVDHLSNWYVRLCRRRFWKGDYSQDKIMAYQTLYECLLTIAKLSAPVAPFYMDRLFSDLNGVTKLEDSASIHLTDFPKTNEQAIDIDLEERMEIAQKLSSMVLALRKKENIKVRQPLQRIMIPVLNEKFANQLEEVKDLILSEVNVKELELLEESSNKLVKTIKPNFKTLGPKYGKLMKQIAAAINAFDANQIAAMELNESLILGIDGQEINLSIDDVEITSEDIPGWLVATEGKYTVALDVSISEELKHEGIAREVINKVQNFRKDSGLDVTDKINIRIQKHEAIDNAVNNNLNYICSETLATSLELLDKVEAKEVVSVELDDSISTIIAIERN